jgi:fatty acid desaturase
MADLQKRGSYTPRRAREQRAYRLIQVGGGAAVVGVAGVVLSVAGVVSAWLPILAFIVVAICLFAFRSVTRNR